MSNEKFTYSYSSDGERYHGSFGTREEALAEGLSDAALLDGEVKRRLYTGRNVPFSVDGESLAEDLAEKLEEVIDCRVDDDSLGEFADGWPNMTKQEKADLAKEFAPIIQRFLDKQESPSFFSVDEIQKHEPEAARQ